MHHSNIANTVDSTQLIMKFFACLVIVAIAAAAQALTDDQKEKLNKISKECKSQTGVTQGAIEKIRNGEFLDEPKVKAQILCVSKKVGLATESGELVVDVLKNKLKKVTDNDQEVDTIMKKCAVKKATPEQTAFDTFKCLHESKPKFSPI